ncbi:MAG: LutC/YkgG family protein [Bryobacteraceae bacterium]
MEGAVALSRDAMLKRVRAALGRNPGQPPQPAPGAHLRVPGIAGEQRVELFCACVERLAGKTYVADSMAAARSHIVSLTEGRAGLASNAPFLAQCGITELSWVKSGIHEKALLRTLCAESDFGITSADFALADTGTLVMLSSPQEARMISLLPPVHIALVPRENILSSLDELFLLKPLPAEQTSSMVLITGPSRTGDIEQILVRGVHGPGEIHVIVAPRESVVPAET